MNERMFVTYSLFVRNKFVRTRSFLPIISRSLAKLQLLPFHVLLLSTLITAPAHHNYLLAVYLAFFKAS